MLTTMNLPSDFSQRTHELLGDNDYRQLEDALQDEAPVSIRVNSAKCDREVKGERVPGLPMEYIWQNVRLLRLILCFMPDAIMYRRLLLCLWNRC